MNLEDLFKDFDEKATIKRVKKFFEKALPRLMTMTGTDDVTLRQSILSDTPRSTKVGNNVERTVIEHLEAKRVIDNVSTALRNLDKLSRTILIDYYVNHAPNWKIAQELGYSTSRYNQLKNKALLNFADAFIEEDLHVYNG